MHDRPLHAYMRKAVFRSFHRIDLSPKYTKYGIVLGCSAITGSISVVDERSTAPRGGAAGRNNCRTANISATIVTATDARRNRGASPWTAKRHQRSLVYDT